MQKKILGLKSFVEKYKAEPVISHIDSVYDNFLFTKRWRHTSNWLGICWDARPTYWYCDVLYLRRVWTANKRMQLIDPYLKENVRRWHV